MNFEPTQTGRSLRRVFAVVLVIFGILETSLGYVGTSDSSIFFFGHNGFGESGEDTPAFQNDLIMPVDVSALRSTSCGGYISVFLYDNGTVTARGVVDGRWEAKDFEDEIASVSSNHVGIFFLGSSNHLIYAVGVNNNSILSDVLPRDANITNPHLSPSRLNEDFRYCAPWTCVAFKNFPPGSETDEPVIHEPNVPLYKFVGIWGSLKFGHIGMDNSTFGETTLAMAYSGPDLIVKKAGESIYFSVFILHNNTVLVSGRDEILNEVVYPPPPTNGPAHLYRPIKYDSSVVNASSLKIVDVSTSPYHALLLSEDHRVFFFGSNFFYASGIAAAPPKIFIKLVKEVPFDSILKENDFVVQIGAQLFRSSAITNMGYVYIWGTQTLAGSFPDDFLAVPTLENLHLQGRYAVKYLYQDDITKTTHDASGSCILSRPRAGNCTGEPPSTDFFCIGGLWTTRGDGSNLDSVIITSATEIDGSLTISGTLTISTQSSISVTECLSTGSIEIVQDNNDNTPSKELISTGKQCPDISSTQITVKNTGNTKKCKKTTASLSKTETNGRLVYSAIFKTDDSDCKLWWIILASVLGGVVLLVIVAILLVSFVKPIRVKVRPFWLRNQANS